MNCRHKFYNRSQSNRHTKAGGHFQNIKNKESTQCLRKAQESDLWQKASTFLPAEEQYTRKTIPSFLLVFQITLEFVYVFSSVFVLG